MGAKSIAPHPWHRARACHPRVAWEPCPVPSRAGAVPELPVCVPTHHVPPLDDPGGGDFFSLSVVVFFFFFLTKTKYLRPHGDGSGSLSMERHAGVPAGEGTPGSVGRVRCRRLRLWRGPQCLYIDMFVRGTGPFLAPKQLEESQKVTKIFHCPRKGGSEERLCKGPGSANSEGPQMRGQTQKKQGVGFDIVNKSGGLLQRQRR